jgi:hypothetical protein
MPELIVSVNHGLSQAEALQRIQGAVAQAKAQYSDKVTGLHEAWDGYLGTFELDGQNLQASGSVAVNPSDVTVRARLPFFMSFFKSTIESRLREELARLLE